MEIMKLCTEWIEQNSNQADARQRKVMILEQKIQKMMIQKNDYQLEQQRIEECIVNTEEEIHFVKKS